MSLIMVEKIMIYAAKILRCTAFIFTLAAGVIMRTINEKATKSTNYTYDAKIIYQDWGAFRFFVIAFWIASGYSFLVMLLPRKSALWRLVVAVDWIITTLMVASFGMTVNTLVELKIGVVEVGWSPLCYIVPGFCNKVIIALAIGFIALVICVPVFLYSIVILANPFLTE